MIPLVFVASWALGRLLGAAFDHWVLIWVTTTVPWTAVLRG